MILRWLEGSRFSEIVPAWKGETVVLLGGGPSLTVEQFELVREAHAARRVKVVSINDSYLLAPWSDGLYAADASWHADHRAGIPKDKLGLSAADVRERYEAFAGWRCSVEDQYSAIVDERVHIVRSKDLPIEPTYSMTAKGLIAGRNSGHQALHLCIHAGITLALLCGFDGGSIDGKTYWHGGHKQPTPPGIWPQIQQGFSRVEAAIEAAGVTVINCSLRSEINSFPKMPLEEALDFAVA